MEITPKIPVRTDKSGVALERRLHVRQRLSSIIYVDIGLDNGGIVLNLSETGMGFQAAGPLGREGELAIKIKLQSSKVRIQVTAQIVWISSSNRQAGIRFLDVRSEDQLQIQEWVRSQAPPPPLWTKSSKPGEEAAGSSRKQETDHELQGDKRLSMLSEIVIPVLNRQKPPEVSDIGTVPTDRTDPADPPDPADLQNSEPASQLFAEPANLTAAEPPTIQEEAEQTHPFQNLSAQANAESEGGDFPIAEARYDVPSMESTLGWPTSISLSSAFAIPRAPDTRPDQDEFYAAAFDSATNSAQATVNTIPSLEEPQNKLVLWNRMAIAALFVLCSVLCFAIGTWVGQIATRRQSIKASTAPMKLAPTADAVINGSIGGGTGRAESPASEKVHTRAATGHTARESRKLEPSKDSLEIVPARQSSLSDAPEHNLATPATAQEQKNIPPVTVRKENSAPIGQNAAPLAITKVQENSPTGTPALENSAAATLSPRIVGGQVLKPSDRFNPCYLAYRVEAEYPPEAQKQQIEGLVKIRQVVGIDGKVRSVKLLSGPPLLVPAALEAARYWRYLPALLNGQPVETEQDVEIEFHLPN
jgi:TonB family protein